MSILKTVGKLVKNQTVLFTVLAAVALIYVMKNYSTGKSLGGIQGLKNSDSRQNSNPAGFAVPLDGRPALGADGAAVGNCGQGNNFKPSGPLGTNETNALVTGVTTNSQGLPPSCAQQQVIDPRQLLPRDENTSFKQMNPAGSGGVENVSLLKAGFHIGINTVGQSLRNANLQLRSEPPNPQLNTGPWNTSSIGPDLTRRALEVGCQGGQ